MPGKNKPQASSAPTFKYGMPLYGCAWPEGNVFFVCGGGGMGIKDRLVLAQSKSGLLSDQLADYVFPAGNCPVRMALHPMGNSVVFAMGKGGIQRLNVNRASQPPKFTEVSGDLQERIANIKGEVNCLAFDAIGEHLALGFRGGGLQVFEWPSLKLKLDRSDEQKLQDTPRDVDFNPSSRSHAIAAVLDNGTCDVWDWHKGKLLYQIGASGKVKLNTAVLLSNGDKTMLQQLPAGMQGAKCSRCRFARDGSNTLYTLMNVRKACHVAAWADTAGMDLPALQHAAFVTNQPGACFEISNDSSMLAVGTSEGAVLVLSMPKLNVVKKVPKAHMVFATGITFSHDGKYVLSISADASAHVTGTMVQKMQAKQIVMLVFILFTLLMVCLLQFVRVMKQQGYTVQQMKQAIGLNNKDEL